MRARRLPAVLGFLFVISPIAALGQGAPQLFFVCGSQPNQPTIYISGVLQGPVTALAGLQKGFLEFLTARFNYRGPVGCLPASSQQNALNIIATKSAAFRNAKKTVIDTGWSESAAAVAAATQAAPATVHQAPRQATTAVANNRISASTSTAGARTNGGGNGAGSGGAGSGSSSSGGSGTSEIASLLSTILGGSGGTSGTAKSQSGGSGDNSSGGGSSGGSAAMTQVSSALKGAFSHASVSSDNLGSSESKTARLVVYGCGRQETRVACVTDLTNRNKTDTLVQASDVWPDAFIVDDRGDRHRRTNGFFLNIDNEQRSQLDIGYGKSARFVLLFDGVPAKVAKVTLRSTADGLNVEDIDLQVP